LTAASYAVKSEATVQFEAGGEVWKDYRGKNQTGSSHVVAANS
jgi:hypothetical protein